MNAMLAVDTVADTQAEMEEIIRMSGYGHSIKIVTWIENGPGGGNADRKSVV